MTEADDEHRLPWDDPAYARRLRRRYAAERRFRIYGIAAIALAIGALVTLLGSICSNALPALRQTYVRLDVFLDPAVIDPSGNREHSVLEGANYLALARKALNASFPDVQERERKQELYELLSMGVDFDVRDVVRHEPAAIGSTRSVWVKVSDLADMYVKGVFDVTAPEADRPITDEQIRWLEALGAKNAIDLRLNRSFFIEGDSREPEMAGVLGALVGSALTLLVTLLSSFPIGVLAAVYLEEFAPRNRWTDLIEVNINNLAAVPSIIFGLLGLAVFLNVFGLPRSAPLAGGLVLALMTLPTVIIAARSALKAVPPSIREAALGVGASDVQVVIHHVLPVAMPGILTGTIIGMARALGETAPLLMIGMVAFIVDVPRGFTEPATVLPVQIYLWADSPERGFVAKTAAAVMVLLAFLIAMNAFAVYVRRRFEIRW
jgi:phosphate transport system permease protein